MSINIGTFLFPNLVNLKPGMRDLAGQVSGNYPQWDAWLRCQDLVE